VQLLVAGVLVRLEASSPPGLADLRAALADGVEADGPPQFVLRSERGGVPQPERRADRAAQHVRYWDQDGAQVVATGPGRTARVCGGRAVLDPGDGGVRGIHGLLMPVLALLFAQQAACLVHGAAFLGDTGTPAADTPARAAGAVLVLGGSGRGKSTLVTAALSARRSVLSDDLLVLRLDAGVPSISGVPQPLALPADQAHHPAVGTAITGDPRSRRAPASGAPLARGTYPVASVLLVEHSARPGGHLRPVDGRAVFGRLLTSTLEGLSPGTARLAFPYAAAVARVPGWELGLPADPAIRVEAAAAWLDQVRAGRAPVA
jgi:hypothetical protein